MAHTLTFPRETTANYYPLETCETRALFHRKNSDRRKTAGSTPFQYGIELPGGTLLRPATATRA